MFTPLLCVVLRGPATMESFLSAAQTRALWAFPDAATVQQRCAALPGANVLDVDAHNIVVYACGAWELVERDVQQVLPGQASAAVLAWLREVQVPQAFALRNELCNLKKAAFYVMQQTVTLERQLAQLATFFHEEHEPTAAAVGSATFWVHSARLTALADARMQAKGAAAGLHDARAISKQCAAMPRHASKGTPSLLAGLPATLHSWRLAKAAKSAAGMSDGESVASIAAEGGAESVASIAAEGGDVAAKRTGELRATAMADGHIAAFFLWHQQALTSLAAQEWPAHVISFVQCVLTARGGDKALRIRDATALAARALEQTLHLLEMEVRQLEALPSVEAVVEELHQVKPSEVEAMPSLQVHQLNALPSVQVVLEERRGQTAADGGAAAGGVAVVDGAAVDGTAVVGEMADSSIGAEGRGEGGAGEGGAAEGGEVEEGGREGEGDEKGGGGGAGDDARGTTATTRGGGDGDDARGHPMMRKAMHRRRHLNLLSGCLPVLADTLEWLRAAMAAAAEGRMLFLAGDGRGARGERGCSKGKAESRSLGWQPALWVASDSPLQGLSLLANLRAVERTHRPQMRAVIGARGWPASIVSRRGAEREHVADNRHCRVCERQFSALWVHRGICCECEAELRAEGRCPYSERCDASWFCPHSRCCFVCDAHGCAACRLERGAAEAVAEVVDRVRPARLCLDFDRTLANSGRWGGRTTPRCQCRAVLPFPPCRPPTQLEAT